MNPLNVRADQRAAAAKNEKLGELYLFAGRQVKCTRCGWVPKLPSNAFYKRVDSPLFAAQDGRICVCKECATKIYDMYCDESDDALFALMKFCCDFNYYYDRELAVALYENGNFSLGKYIQSINMQRKGLSFANNFADVYGTGKEPVVVPETPKYERSSNWSIEDRKNKANVISQIGYDPFVDGGYTDENLKYLYNTCAGYLTESVEEDPHKLQSVVLMCKTYLQIDIIDKMLSKEFNSVDPNSSLISSLTTMKEKLSATIIRIANENGFSEKTSGKSLQGSNTLSQKMKDMAKNKFSLAKVNIHDVRQSEAFRSLAAMNAHSLVEEMNLTGDDFARLCAEQRKFVSELQEENEDISEQNRLLSIRVKDLEAQIRKMK